MIIPEHRACDICGEPIYGDLPSGRVRKVYFELLNLRGNVPTERIVASDVDICEPCWKEMSENILNRITKRLEDEKKLN